MRHVGSAYLMRELSSFRAGVHQGITAVIVVGPKYIGSFMPERLGEVCPYVTQKHVYQLVSYNSCKWPAVYFCCIVQEHGVTLKT
jgi:hypothetical protein